MKRGVVEGQLWGVSVWALGQGTCVGDLACYSQEA